MNQHIENLKAEIEPFRAKLVAHPLYSNVKSIDELKLFMEAHIFAVWDFMTLLKALQRNLTCTTLPWVPVGSANTRFLINEIVVGEESDVNQEDVRMSHYELYLTAMAQCGANANSIKEVIALIETGMTVEEAMTIANVPAYVKQFVAFTFEVAMNQPAYIQAAVFTFGREDLIPDMFMSIVTDFDRQLPQTISIMKYYLERHIEVDGGHHSHLALEMTAELCEADDLKWKNVAHFVAKALEVRIALWDGILENINSKQLSVINN